MAYFDLFGELPTGPLLLEASAGTGKTYAIVTLAARMIAETDYRVNELLLITFTNRAADQLRSRLYQRLQVAQDQLAAHLANGTQPSDDLARHLSLGDAEGAFRRISAALAGFEAAAITTIHSFCRNTLQTLGVLGDWDDEQQVATELADIVSQSIADTYLAGSRNSEPPFSFTVASHIGKTVCESSLPLAPNDSAAANFGHQVRQAVTARKRAAGIVTFSDQVNRLRELVTTDGSEALIAELRRRFRAVFVDEFQDTDAAQWEVLRNVFVTETTPCVLIGDPKQSIYAFRDADLDLYLDASRLAQRQSLATNYRSDQQVIDGITELFSGAVLGPEVSVSATRCVHRDRLRAGDLANRLWLRSLPAAQHDREAAITDDLVALTQQLLGSDQYARIVDGDWRQIQPSDIAILVRRSAMGHRLVAALNAHGIPAEYLGADNIFASPAATHWLRVLTAIVSPSHENLLLAAMTPLFGYDLTSIDETALTGIWQQLTAASQPSEKHPTLSLGSKLLANTGPTAAAHGAAMLSDLWHLATLLDQAQATSVAELRDWLLAQLAGPSDQLDEQRISTEQPRVRVLTLHAAKGLEFPITMLPDVDTHLWTPRPPARVMLPTSGRVLFCERLVPGSDVAKRYQQQAQQEDLRLLYVGLTRASLLSIVWHDPHAVIPRDSIRSGLSSLLGTATSQADWSHLDLQVADERPAPGQPAATLASSAFAELRPAEWTRKIDQDWRRTSYSGITSGLHDAPPNRDEGTDLDFVPQTESGTLAAMAELPSGPAFGTLVHELLEQLDWQPDTLPEKISELAASHAGAIVSQEAIPQLVRGIADACTTPLGGLADGMSLSELPIATRLAELDFDLPLGDGGNPARIGDLAELLATHLDDTDPLADYPRRLAATPAAETVLSGFLTGSIDAVLQVPSGRFVVVDYKTNRFPAHPSSALTLQHYGGAAMAEAMMQAHYPLQALLYCAALHRYLGWRLPDYRPEQHLGGVGYLFVRGMGGQETPSVDGMTCGVFEWYPSPELVVATSQLLGGNA